MPKSLEEAVDMIIEYAQKYPEINGNKTYAFTALAWSWREFPLMNAPHVFSGHPNDGSANVDFVDGKWVASQFYDTEEAYKVYKIYNKIHKAGLYDTESFVMDYDQYLAKLSTGSILAFYDQRWQFEKVNKLLLDQGEDRFYVALPVVMEGYTEEFEGPLGIQVSEGVGITVDCKDPVGAFKYLDFLLSEEVQKRKQWGIVGEHYEIDDNGYFYRTPEQVDIWENTKWVNYTYGQKYWIEMCGWSHKSMYSDGKNAVDQRNQPSVFYARLKPDEKEVLDAYGKKTWFDFFKKPNMKRAKYFPLWTIKIPTGSDVHIAHEKINEVRRKYTPMLIMASEGEYDAIWEEYIAELNTVPNRDKHEQFFQDQLDKRMEMAGGY
jgi:putative aldouronate transport system substrate-binding protein